MSNAADLMWLIPALPLASAVLTTFAGPTLLKERSHWPCVLALATSFLLSLAVLLAVRSSEAATIQRYYTWFRAGEVDVGFTLRADGLSAVMLVTVTLCSTLIAVYSAGYMHGDPGYARYFAEVSLFVFSMTGLVLADNFLLLYAFWEGVGLCSYLLIGFWFTRPSAAAAARKAFLVTRLGDLGLIIGIILLWTACGHALDYDTVFAKAPKTGILGVACLLIFCGAVGKSAQFPLHVWLPDAMEGPTPVSALIHAATMVTAGVYLVARCAPLFSAAPAALAVVASIGAFTALLAALIALTQTDLKRVLAYSTISQLGFMFLALGSGVATDLVRASVVAAIFHLFTHAFFKALLFLGAGSVMHAMGNVIDMRRFGGLRKLLPVTHWTFLCGALALAGFPLFSGFWSKDEILAVNWDASRLGTPYPTLYRALFASAVLTAALTAFYTFRAYFLTFWGEERVPPEAGHHAHESPEVMLVPLRVLAVFAALAGLVFGPTHWFADYLNAQWSPGFGGEEAAATNFGVMAMGTVAALAGIGLAWFIYVRRPATANRMAAAAPGLYELSRQKFFIDDIYGLLIVGPLRGLAALCRVFDLYVIDGLVDLVGHIPALVGAAFRPLQNGLVQFYALTMALSLTVFLLALAVMRAVAE